MTRTTQRGTGALIATLLAILLSLSAVSPAFAAEGPTTSDPAEAAAGWLAGQLVDGERLETVFGDEAHPDHGLTADAVFALASAGVASEHISTAVDWLVGQTANYTGFDSEAYAGATAKLILALVTDNRDPRDSDGIDLVDKLLDREQGAEAGDDQGRFMDASEWGEHSSTLTQSLAVLALHRADDVSPSTEAVGFLLAQQCDDGGFRFGPDEEACDSDADTTAFAVQALAAIDGRSDQAEAAAGWLVTLQGDDGGISTGFGANSNTTGLAAVAFEVTDNADAADAARRFLLGLQDGCDSEGTGAILFDAEDDGDRVRATAQAVPGIAGIGLATVTSSGASDAVPTLDCTEEDPEDPSEPEQPVDPEGPKEPGEAALSDTATISCELDQLQVVAGEEVACAVTDLHADETIGVKVTVNPTLLDEEFTADDNGTVEFAVTIPDDRAAGETVTLTVTNVDGSVLTSLELTIVEVLPETGLETRISLLGIALLGAGGVLLLSTRRRSILA